MMRAVYVAGAYKGEVEEKNGRLSWRRRRGGIDTFPKGATTDEVRAFIARVCLAEVGAVELRGAK